ncbi:protease complex subunit PrcB family protein [Candidatus Woesearchaeota archaeon]|nr:protease complex subunit PrcB family protein [Candidatus Woesearchaeota archaeon]
MKKTLLSLVLLASTSLSGCSKQYSLETISKGHFSLAEQKLEFVIKDAEKWKKHWRKYVDSENPAPEIDFSNYSVVAVYSGTKSAGGYSIEIASISKSRFFVEVSVKETVPSIDGIVIEIMMSPYHIVKTDKISKKEQVVFRYE